MKNECIKDWDQKWTYEIKKNICKLNSNSRFHVLSAAKWSQVLTLQPTDAVIHFITTASKHTWPINLSSAESATSVRLTSAQYAWSSNKDIMDILDEQDIIKLNAFDFCHSKVRKGKRAMWWPSWRLVYIKESADESLCQYCNNKTLTITEVLLSNNDTKSDKADPTLAGVFDQMMEDLTKQVAKWESWSEWTHPISNKQLRKCKCELRVFSRQHQKWIL